MGLDLEGLSAGADENIGSIESALASGPLTMSAWVYKTALGQGTILSLTHSAGAFDYVRLTVNSGDPGTAVIFAFNGDFASGGAFTSAVVNDDEWTHIAGVVVGDADRRCFVNGGNKATLTTSIPSVNAYDEIAIGSYNGLFQPNEQIIVAECGFWDAALSDAEITDLAAGCSPLMVRPQSLKVYHPCYDEATAGKNWAGPHDITIDASSADGEHPPGIIYPHEQIYHLPAADALIDQCKHSHFAWGRPWMFQVPPPVGGAMTQGQKQSLLWDQACVDWQTAGGATKVPIWYLMQHINSGGTP